jgi:ADP-ribosylglycohydrolase
MEDRLKDKIQGMFMGIAIGDALGMPVETFSADRIEREFDEQITDYVSAEGHKWFDGREPGTWTDDTQLSLAVAEALIEKKEFDMDSIAQHHVKALDNPEGWGASTREAIQRIRDGVHWSRSASETTAKKARGVGNGVSMKISPLAAYHFLNNVEWKRVVAECVLFAKMTHPTNMGIASALAQNAAVQYCLEHDPQNFSKENFADTVINQSQQAEILIPVKHGSDNLATKLKEIKRYHEYNRLNIIQSFGGGSCYAYNSLPFSFMFFLKEPSNIETLYTVVNAGGDTDTNASMVGALLGALNGLSIFPQNLVDKLDQNEVLWDVGERFCEAFLEAPEEDTN